MRYNTVINDRSARFIVNLGTVEQSSESSEKITSTWDNNCKYSWNNSSRTDRFFIFDRIKFPDHLRKSPCSKRSKKNNAQKIDRIRTKKRCKRSRLSLCQGNITWYLRHFCYCIHESALSIQNRRDHSHNSDQHNDSLYEIIDCRSHISAQDNIERRKRCHCHDTPRIRNIKSHRKQTWQTVIHRSRVRDQKNEHDHRCRNLKWFALVPFSEKIRHRPWSKMLCHHFCTPSENYPCQKASD